MYDDLEFNIQNFGMAKMSNERVVKIIVNIIRHFDVIVLQEIVDKSVRIVFTCIGGISCSGIMCVFGEVYIHVLWFS